LDTIDKAIQNNEFDLELDAVDTWFECPLQVEQVGALDAKERNVKCDDEEVGVYQLTQHPFLLGCLHGLTVLDGRRGGPGALTLRRGVA
jgi:hypothetical protein